MKWSGEGIDIVIYVDRRLAINNAVPFVRGAQQAETVTRGLKYMCETFQDKEEDWRSSGRRGPF